MLPMAAAGADEAVRPAQPDQRRAALLLGAEGLPKRLVAQTTHARCNLEPHSRDPLIRNILRTYIPTGGVSRISRYAFGKADDREAVETYAHLWGFRRCSPDGGTEHVHVDRISVCVSAQVANDRATVFTDVIALQGRYRQALVAAPFLAGRFPYPSIRLSPGADRQ